MTNGEKNIFIPEEDVGVYEKEGYQITEAPEAPKKVAKRTSNEE